MILYRGPRNEDELKCIITNKTAGGKIPNPNPTKPSDHERDEYGRTTKITAGECARPRANQHIETVFTEYTVYSATAKNFGRRLAGDTYRRGAYICIDVNDAYVNRFEKDVLEGGVLIRSDTPITICEIFEIYD